MTTVLGYYCTGRDAEGNPAAYPADDYLRDMSVEGTPVLLTAREAIDTARAALIDTEGWREVQVHRCAPGPYTSFVVATILANPLA